MFEGSFTVLTMAVLVCREALPFSPMEVLVSVVFYGSGFVIELAGRLAFVAFACFLGLGGAIMGTVYGAINGQSKGFGLVSGAGIGAISGAFVATQLLASALTNPSLTKVEILGRLVNGNAFVEYWIVESLYREISDGCDDSGFEGLSKISVQELPVFKFQSCKSKNDSRSNVFSCRICLEDLEDGEIAKSLPNCGHLFHRECIDDWLHLHGSCPNCRKPILVQDSTSSYFFNF